MENCKLSYDLFNIIVWFYSHQCRVDYWWCLGMHNFWEILLLMMIFLVVKRGDIWIWKGWWCWGTVRGLETLIFKDQKISLSWSSIFISSKNRTINTLLILILQRCISCKMNSIHPFPYQTWCMSSLGHFYPKFQSHFLLLKEFSINWKKKTT